MSGKSLKPSQNIVALKKIHSFKIRMALWEKLEIVCPYNQNFEIHWAILEAAEI